MDNLGMNNGKKIATIVLSALTLIGLCSAAAMATPRNGDYFSRTTGNNPAHAQPTHLSAGANVRVAPRPQITMTSTPDQWFTAVDEMIYRHRPTKDDKFILERDFNLQAERVIEWTNTAAKVAKNYRELARQIRSVPVPQSMASSQTRQYLTRTSEWYDDAASVFEDYIHPREAARTQEELDRTLEQMRQRSISLENQSKTLQAMDTDLRDQFNVHVNLTDDPIQRFVRRGTDKQIK